MTHIAEADGAEKKKFVFLLEEGAKEDFCDNGVLRSDKAKIRQISPSSLFFDVSICTFCAGAVSRTLKSDPQGRF